jgi:hypothetical protein
MNLTTTTTSPSSSSSPPMSSSTQSVKCWACAWTGQGHQHANQQLAANSHAPPPPAWLQRYDLRYCTGASHAPWVHCGRECIRCKRAARASFGTDAVDVAAPASSASTRLPSSQPPLQPPQGARATVSATFSPSPATTAAASTVTSSVSIDTSSVVSHLSSSPSFAAAAAATTDVPTPTPRLAVPQPAAPHTANAASKDLRQWLQDDASVPKVEAAVLAAATARPRRFLPRSAYTRQLAATTMLDIVTLARDGHPAAQALLPYAPRVLFARDVPLFSQVAALIAGRAVDACHDKRAHDPTLAYHARVRAAVAMADLRALNRLLAEGVMPSSASDASIDEVFRTKFPYKPEGELPNPATDEAQWLTHWRARCGGHTTTISQRDLIRWARAKRDRAADAGGYSGRLILELHSIDPAITANLATVWSMDPVTWAHRGAAFATWRVLRGAFIPQPKPLPRPVATASVARRAWGSCAVRSIRDAAATYCEERGQFGLSRADGQTAYALAAGVFHALGGDVAVDDRSNSFHELYRSSIYSGVTSFLSALPPESLDTTGRTLVDVVARTFAGPPSDTAPTDNQPLHRSQYVFPADIPPRTHHALCQGSSESSLLEAVTYAQSGWRTVDLGVRCELHDDGFTAALPAAPLSAFTRPPTHDGSRVADSKDVAVGPRAQRLVDAGCARKAADFVFVAGIPVGDTAAALDVWKQKYTKKLSHIREIAQLDSALAATAAVTIGGPAGLANHILRALQPTPQNLSFWRAVDDEWLDLWLDILRLDHADRSPATRDIVRDRLFLCKGGCGLRQRAAADVADIRYAEGIADAAVTLARIIERSGHSFASPAIWDSLGATAWRASLDPGELSSYSPSTLRRAAHNHARAAVTAAASVDDARFARVMKDGAYCHGPRENPSSSSPSAALHRPPNLLAAWLRYPSHSTTSRMPPADALIALRRLFGLPITGQATAILLPPSCVRCNAPAISTTGGTAGAQRHGPRERVDRYGEHALACARSRGDTQRRHNEMAYAIRSSIDPTGWGPECRGGPVFEGHGGRPADIWVARHPRHPAGQALDCTVVTTEGREPGAAVIAAEAAKRDKYAHQVARSPGLGFAPRLRPPRLRRPVRMGRDDKLGSCPSLRPRL